MINLIKDYSEAELEDFLEYQNQEMTHLGTNGWTDYFLDKCADSTGQTIFIISDEEYALAVFFSEDSARKFIRDEIFGRLEVEPESEQIIGLLGFHPI